MTTVPAAPATAATATPSLRRRPPSADDERVLQQLSTARHDGNRKQCARAEENVVVHFLSVATAVARRYSRRGLDSDDLEQVARIGLVKATRRWRADRGSFLAYAVPTVTGEVKRYFRDHGSAIRIPRALYEAQPRVAAAERQLRQEQQGDPSPAEIADRAGMTSSQVEQVQAAVAACRPLTMDGYETIPQPRSSEPERDLATVDFRERLRPALATLSQRERTIVVLRFIWDQSQVEIAGALGLSQMQISRLLRATLAKLHDRMADDETS